MPKEMEPSRRRDVLKLSASALAAGSVGLAGCMGNSNSSSNSSDSSESSGDSDTSEKSSGGEEFTLNIGHPMPPSDPNVQALKKKFVEPLEKKTDGRIKVNIQAATLGGTEDYITALQSGTVDIVIEAAYALESRFSNLSGYSFAGVPFAVKDVDHYKAIEEKYLLPEDGMNGKLSKHGLRLFGSHRWGNRGTTSNMPVRKPEDVQDVKMRLPQFPTWIGSWEEIGVEPTPVSFDELYSALETGLVESSEGPISQFMSKSLYEVQSHFTVTNHLLGMYHFIMNDDFYHQLSSDDQDVIVSTINEATPKMTDYVKAQEADLYDKAKEKGTTIITADEIDHKGFQKAAKPYLKEIESEWVVDYDDILNLA